MYDIKNFVLDFEKVLKVSGFSPKTIDTYCYWLTKFVEYSFKFPIQPEMRIRDFLGQWKLTSSNYNVAYHSIVTFYRLVLKKPCPYIRESGSECKKLFQILSVQDVTTVLKYIPQEPYRVMVALMYSSGLRGAEVINLKIGDIQYDELKIIVPKSSGRSERITLISQRLLPNLQQLAGERSPLDRLFLNPRGKPINIRTLQLVFKRALEKSGINADVTCQSLRQSFAVHLWQNGVDVKAIQKLLGHKQVKSTAGYLTQGDKFPMHIQSPY